uniref:ARAD1D09130p n=1 Tax=Blastobotrys adeninivorans TaxID=409370 RepID=A0A060TEN2_BLAAD
MGSIDGPPEAIHQRHTIIRHPHQFLLLSFILFSQVNATWLILNLSCIEMPLKLPWTESIISLVALEHHLRSKVADLDNKISLSRTPCNCNAMKRSREDPKRGGNLSSLTGVPLNYLSMVGQIRAEARRTEDRPLKKRKSRRKDGDERSGSEPPAESSERLDHTEDQIEHDKEQLKDVLAEKVEAEEGSDLDESEDSDEDIDWEQVDIETRATPDIPGVGDSEDPSNTGDETLTVTLNPQTPPKARQSAKLRPLSKREQQERLIIHKIHLICLLFHVHLRNLWCNDRAVLNTLRHVFSPIVEKELHPPDHLSDTLKTRKFLDGLRHAAAFWKKQFRVTSNGLRMVSWRDIMHKDREIESAMDLPKFRKGITTFKGSRDLGAQAFCAALRAAGVKTRLVCSLQPLDFTSRVALASEDEVRHTVPGPSPIPTFWIEAFEPISKRWVTVEPMVTLYVEIVRSRTKTKLEPAQNDMANSLRYVVGFDAEGAVVDVTRRYSHRYNAKTRKKRITSVSHEESQWYDRLIAIFQRRVPTEDEIAEQKELSNRESAEGLPSSLQDLKGHPKFVIEEHLRKDEVLSESCTPYGKISLRGRLVPVYRRTDVYSVKSAQKWYRLGRILKPGCQPRKLSIQKRPLSRLDEDSGQEETVGLYSEDQTELYVPPPVENGVVPKNQFNNIDLYVPSMLPKGAVHIPYDGISVAARLVEVDYADAVVGFEYANRKMNAKKKGIVVAKEHAHAVMTAYNQLLEEQKEEDRQVILAKALLRWRKFLVALRIKDRLDRRHGKIDRPLSEAHGNENELESAEPEEEVQENFETQKDSMGWDSIPVLPEEARAQEIESFEVPIDSEVTVPTRLPKDTLGLGPGESEPGQQMDSDTESEAGGSQKANSDSESEAGGFQKVSSDTESEAGGFQKLDCQSDEERGFEREQTPMLENVNPEVMDGEFPEQMKLSGNPDGPDGDQLDNPEIGPRGSVSLPVEDAQDAQEIQRDLSNSTPCDEIESTSKGNADETNDNDEDLSEDFFPDSMSESELLEDT